MFDYNDVIDAVFNVLKTALSRFWADFHIQEVGLDVKNPDAETLSLPFAMVHVSPFHDYASDSMTTVRETLTFDVILVEAVQPGTDHLKRMRTILASVADDIQGNTLGGLVLTPGCEVRDMDWNAPGLRSLFLDSGVSVGAGRLVFSCMRCERK